MDEEQIIIDKYIGSLVTDIVFQYHRLGLKASGRFEKELKYTYDPSTGRIQVLAPDYIRYLEMGRGKGVVPVSVIKRWIRNKGLTSADLSQDQLAWAIATKIERDGIKVPNRYNEGTILEPVDKFIEQNRIEQLGEELAFHYGERFEDRFGDIFKGLNR